MQAEIKILFDDPITIYATDKSTYIVAGKEYTVHKRLAEKLVSAGKASYTPVKKITK